MHPGRWILAASALFGCSHESPPLAAPDAAVDVPSHVAPPDAPFDAPVVAPFDAPEVSVPFDARSVEATVDAAPAEPSTPPASLGPGFVALPYAVAGPTAFAPANLRPNDPLALSGGVAADVDGDGAAEVLLGTVLPGERTAMVAFRYDPASGNLSPLVLPGVGSALPLALLDLDGDGHADLLQNTPSVAWGLGGARFTAASPLDPGRPSPQPDDVQGAAVADLDGDGWLDLLLGSRRCCATCSALTVLLRDGARHFSSHPEALPLNPTGGAWAVLATPLGPDRMVLATFATCARSEPAFFRPTALDAAGLPRFDDFDPTPPTASFRSTPDPCPSPSCRVPMGAFVGFIDEDDAPDLALSLLPSHVIFRGGASYPFAEASPQQGFTEVRAATTGRPMIPWGSAFVDLDQDGRPDALTVHGDDFGAAPDDPSFIGPQRVAAHWNAGAFRLVDLTAATRLGERSGQWRSLFVGDLDADGDADLIVGANGGAPVVYRNDLATGHRGLSLRLRGVTSNALGLGARVTVWPRAGARPQRYLVGGVASPHSVSDPLVFVGLGSEAQAALVRVEWPSGIAQELTGLAAGREHTVSEPALFVIDPPSRHAPADGRSVVTVRVTPRAGARVELAITHGAGTVLGVTPDPGSPGAFLARVQAPTRAGSARLEVRVDGVASGVHPRLWWD